MSKLKCTLDRMERRLGTSEEKINEQKDTHKKRGHGNGNCRLKKWLKGGLGI